MLVSMGVGADNSILDLDTAAKTFLIDSPSWPESMVS